MEEKTILSVLRILAVATVLYGLVLATQALISIASLQEATGGPGMEFLSNGKRWVAWGVISGVAVSCWGLVLFARSPYLSRLIPR